MRSKLILRQGVLWEVLPGKPIDEWRGLAGAAQPTEVFSPADMQSRWNKLKREKRVSDLTEVIKIVRREVSD